MHDAWSREDLLEWQKAMQNEFASLTKNKFNTWELTTLVINKHVVNSKWVFKIRTKVNGSIDWYKAYLVAWKLTQILEIDFTKSFSPIVKFNSIHILLALAQSKDASTQGKYFTFQWISQWTYLYGNIWRLKKFFLSSFHM
jgi:hypothetical protein